MTTIEVSLSAASLYYQQAAQVFTTCCVRFTEKRIRDYHHADADAYIANLNAKYAKRYQLTPEQGSAGWDLAFVLLLWQSDGDLHPKYSDDDNETPDDNANGSYIPRIFGLSNQLRKFVSPQFLNSSRLPAIINIKNYQVWVLNSDSFYAIRHTRNNWAHGKVTSIDAYATAVRHMYTTVRALPSGMVQSDELNMLAYTQGALQHMVDLESKARSEGEKSIQQIKRLQQQIVDAKGEIAALQSRLAQSTETTQQQQATQAEQQMLVQALLTHMASNTYDTNTTIGSLQAQIHDIKAQDRDDMLLATIVQLQQMVVQQRATIRTLEEQIANVAQTMSTLTRTKSIDPNTVPTKIEEQSVSKTTDTNSDADDTTSLPRPVLPGTPAIAEPLRHPWQALGFVLLTTIAMVVLWVVQSGQWVIPAQWLHIWPF